MSKPNVALESDRARASGMMQRLVARHDWSPTLGPRESWSPVLSMTAEMVLGHGFPMILLWGPRLIQIYNDGYAEVLGPKHPAGLGQPTEQCWPEVWHINGPIYERVRAGETVTYEDKLYPLARDGTLRDAWFTLTYSPVREPGDAEVAGVLVTVFETTKVHVAEQERAAMELDLREAEARSRTLVEGISQAVWEADPQGQVEAASASWRAYTGQSGRSASGEGWMDAVHPDDRAKVRSAWFNAMASQRGVDADFRLRHADTRDYRWTNLRAVPLRYADGAVKKWVAMNIDIHDERVLKEQQEELLAQLQHRVRNILSVVRSVFARTVDTGRSLDDIADHFRGRLDNLARTQVGVTRTAAGMLDLENLIRDELLSVGESDGPRLVIDGPEIELSPKTAEGLGLAVHELTTNSLKYGALRAHCGDLAIKWRLERSALGARSLEFTWEEFRVPTVPVQPDHLGFGTELIEQALPYQLKATTELEFRGGGVRCKISVPLSDEEGIPASGRARGRGEREHGR